MNWIIAAAGLASISLLGAQATQPHTQPRETQPQRTAQPGETRPGQGAQPRPGERPSASDTSRPGEHHEILEPVIGEWTALVTVHRGGREIESRGTMRNEWVLGKRFIRGEYTGDEETGGERREGVSYLGYNNATDEYEAMWMDTSSTQFMLATGHLEQETKVLTLHGKYTDETTGNEIPTRIVARMETEDRIIWEMYENPDGQREHKTLEIVYTRSNATDQEPLPPELRPPGGIGEQPAGDTPAEPNDPRPEPWPRR